MYFFTKWAKQPCFKVSSFFFLVLLLGGAPPAGAALISTSAAIDWSTFKITPIDIGNGLPTLTWNNQSDYSQASVGSCCGNTYDSASNWSSGTLATESGSTSTYIKSASASTSINEIKADASINGSFLNQSLYTNSNSQRSGGFTVQGNGLLLFQANYSLTGDVGTAPNAYATTTVSFNLSSYNEGGNGSASQTFSHNIYNGSPAFSEAGVLAVALAFRDGWSGNFSGAASTYVNSYGGGGGSVPLPAAFWLFGSALAGVAALRRPNIGPLKIA